MKNKIINIGLIGLGRVGKMHAENINRNLPLINLKSIADPVPDIDFIQELDSVRVCTNADDIILDNTIQAVIICSPTPTHFELIKKCAKNKKHVFCEKPISFSGNEIQEIISIMINETVIIQVGLNRRFDQEFMLLKEKINGGLVGEIQMIHITNHDASIPEFKFLKSSGGMLFDLCIHDFDMLSFITGEKIKEIYVNGDVFIEPRLNEINDIDNAIITLELENGILCSIDSSRQTHYGYDQRIEVFGSKGMISVENKPDNLYLFSNELNTKRSKIKYSFIERYKESYVTELEHFYTCITENNKPNVGPEEILSAIRVAAAGKKSIETNNPEMVKI